MMYEMMPKEYGLMVSRSAQNNLGADGGVSVFQMAGSSIFEFYHLLLG